MKNKLLTVKDYSEAEGITTSAVYLRIKRGTLLMIKKYGTTLVFVDSDKTKSAGRPKKDNK